MSRLIIVDQSLKDVGGHHFDYVLQMAKAAVEQNLEVIVVTHRQFQAHSHLEHYARIVPQFRRTTYSKYSLLAGLRAMHRRSPLQYGGPEQDPRSSGSRLRSDLGASPLGTRKFTRLGEFGDDEPENQALPGNTGKHVFDRSKWSQSWTQLAKGWGSIQQFLLHLQDSNGRQRVVNQFASDCRQLFAKTGILATDHVFFTTISDLELAGLLVYWMGAPESYLPYWHLQFHFDVFDGRPPEYRKQYAALEPLRCLFEDIDNAVPTHQLRYYATTSAIADQYQRLASRPISELIYPISSTFQVSDSPVRRPAVLNMLAVEGATLPANHFESPAPLWIASDTQGVAKLPAIQSTTNFPSTPLWSPQATGVPIVVAGGVRSEKGQKGLQEVWPELKRQVLDPGLGFLVCQRTERAKWYKRRFAVSPVEPTEQDAQLQYVPHPLSTNRYQQLIKQAGIGLLTYDQRSYANRRAGVFGEYLAAGVPTLVPAGTWMSDQLSEFHYAYHQQILRQHESVACWNHGDFDWSNWNVPSGSGSITFDGNDVPAYAWSPELPNRQWHADSEARASQLLSVRFHWVWPKEVGTYCRVEVLFYDQQRHVLAADSMIVGQQRSTSAQAVFFRVPEGTHHFRLGLSNAFHERNATIQRLLVDVIATPQSLPTATVGLTFDQRSQIPARLRELCEHHTAYRASAQATAASWFRRHDPAAALTQLLSAESAAQQWAA